MPRPEGLALRVRGLEVRAEGGRILAAVDSLTLRPGESLAVRGPSGAGKSTLLMALAGLVRAAAGSLHWGETDLATLPPAGLAAFRRTRLGIVFQDFLLFEEMDATANASVAAAFAPARDRAALRRRATGLLSDLGLGTGATRPAAGYSGGERQRIAVARALLSDPPILLADEPTASLDRASADRMIDTLAQVAGGATRTMVVVSHDAALIARMGRVIDMEDGRIVADSGARDSGDG